jgi:polyisoprenoid-binding protein YceI
MSQVIAKIGFVLSVALATTASANEAKKAPAKKEATKKEAAAKPAAETLNVDTTASEVAWVGKKVTGQHDGKIKIKSGKVEVVDGQLKGGTFTIDMASMTVADIKDADTAGKFLGHMKSDDFFAVEKHPESVFTITSVKPGKDGAVTVTGDLTVKGVKKPLSFDTKPTYKDGVFEAPAAISVDRTKWDIKYGSGKFFKSLGDKAIHDVFTMDVKLVAKK